ncbi:putative bifunctional diguanylate cyclase/phosphodiesterase [Alteromonas aestuariivivens]|nr:EAL domain-containing protein [Alteromonas aestuariivivens]
MSFTTKVMLILLVMMLSVTIAIASLLISQSTENLERQHLNSQIQNQRRYELLDELLIYPLVLWVESFSQFVDTNDMEGATDRLHDAWEYLNINLQVDDLWLFSPSGQVLYGERSELPAFALRQVKRSQEELRPLSRVYCELVCRRYVSVPVMGADQQTSVMVLSSNMQEVLAQSKQLTGAVNLAIVRRIPDMRSGTPTLQVISRLRPEYQVFFTTLLNHLPKLDSLDTLIQKGVTLELNERQLLVSLLPLEDAYSNGQFILYAQDITESVAANRAYRRQVVGSAIGLFALFSVLMYLFLNQYRRKLLALSEHLPLLAMHRYQDFLIQNQQIQKWQRSWFTDELDVLDEAANSVAKQLEEFDSQIALNTAQLEKMAMFDSLTGLPNRNMLTFQIEKQVAGSSRTPSMVALMFLDLDDFKKVNDSYGHDVGDKLLKAAAKRIAGPIRETDIAARFGGDEFVVLLSDVSEREQVEVVARKLLQEFASPIQIGDMQFYISVSIGIALTQHAEASAVELLRHADIAMYEAKAQQGAAFRIFDATMNLKVMRKVELESEARVALRENQFSLALQPQLELRTRRLMGFEALIRWHHPVKGHISPGEFIPLLENTSFMLELDYWVITHATRLLRELSANGHPYLKMAINLSSAQFMDPSLPEFLAKQIELNGIQPSQIELELTENVLVADMKRAKAIMKTIREMGCLLAIDDFGTGYSSLSYLKALPADFIKIDQSFVAGMLENPDDRSIVYSTLTMIRNMGLMAIAEGIENAAQYELLCHFDCHQGQGYLISMPVPEADIWDCLNECVKDQVWCKPLPIFKPEES